MGSVVINLSFNAVHDKDVLDWLEKQRNKSEAVRQALRETMNQEESAVIHKLNQILALLEELESGN